MTHAYDDIIHLPHPGQRSSLPLPPLPATRRYWLKRPVTPSRVRVSTTSNVLN